MFVTGFAQNNLVCFFIYPVIAFAFFGFLANKVGRNGVHHTVELNVVIRLTGNNQRRTRFVNQNGVHFVDYCKVQFALNFVVLVGHHIVAQVVKTELVVCTVSNVGTISSLAFERLQIGYDYADAQA